METITNKLSALPPLPKKTILEKRERKEREEQRQILLTNLTQFDPKRVHRAILKRKANLSVHS